jgi:lysophospholipase L1-like esterase
MEKKPKTILTDTERIIEKIKRNYSDTEIVLIAAKPSLARWHLKRKYKKLNRKFQRLCKNDPSLEFADIWDTMLDGRKVREDIFIEDGLHMNAKGYALWLPVIRTFIN